MKKLFIIHPFLFALFPVLFLFSHNVGQVSFSEVLIPAVIVVSIALLLLVLFRLIFWDTQKAGIATTIFLIFFFSYGHVWGAVQGWLEINAPSIYGCGPIIWIVLFSYTVYLIKRARGDLRNFTNLLSIVATCLVAISLINIVTFKLETVAARQDIKSSGDIEISTAVLGEESTLPSIYYIILDRYANERVLKEIYGFDNREFINYLSSKGFYVASKSRSNYLKSSHSLASSLNMEFINYLGSRVGEESGDWAPIYTMLEDYKVWRFLKSKGYKFIHLGSWWRPTNRNKYADKSFHPHALSEFLMVLYETTALYPFDPVLNILGGSDLRSVHRETFLYQLDKLAEISNTKGPFFAFAHILIPHEPYVFDRDGKFLSVTEVRAKGRIANYVDQLRFCNKKVRMLIERLLSSPIPPIIILQADEGPRPLRYALDERNFNWEQASVTELREKTGILNAYHLPGIDKSVFYPSITPVNSFRLIFDLYFGMDLGLLPDESYAHLDDKHPYKFFNITSKVGR